MHYKLIGQRKIVFVNGDLYEGETKNGKMHGKGIMRYAHGIFYEGEWKDGKRHGKGKMRFTNGEFCKGQWKNNKKHGRFKIISKDGVKKETIFVNGRNPRLSDFDEPNFLFSLLKDGESNFLSDDLFLIKLDD